MEIDITHMFAAETWDYAGSVLTHGPDAAKRTFLAACKDADELFPDVGKEDLVEHFVNSGAWAREELEASSLTELRGMLVQDITGEMRETGLEDFALEDVDWEAHEAAVTAGECPSSIYRGDDGRVYFWMEV